MLTANSYLHFNGNAEEAFRFYQSVFGGEFSMLEKYSSTDDGKKLSAADQNKVLHVSLPLGDSGILMGSDILESMGHKYIPGNNYYIYLNTDSRDEADRIFHSLSDGGNVAMPMQDVFWGSYFGMFTDRFGVQWMLSCNPGN